MINTLPRTFSINTKMRVAIIVPYRNRAEHLARFFVHFDSLSLPTQFEIFVIEQVSKDKFNLGLLRNAGFFIAIRTQHFDRYIFHDVDSYPSPTLFRQYAAFPRLNIHYASPYLGYKYKYDQFMGGVIGFNPTDFVKINGYPNTFFGWGGEDDALYSRVIATNVAAYRPAVGRYKLADHAPPTSAEKNMLKREGIAEDKVNWRDNGITQLASSSLNIKYRRLDAPTDMVPAPAPEMPLAHFRRGRDNCQIHFYAIDWPSTAIGGAKKLLAEKQRHSKNPHGYDAAYLARNPENEGRYISTIREYMAQISPRKHTILQPSIALLFIVQDKMPLIDIWTTWLSLADDSMQIDIFIHAKYPIALRNNLGAHPFAKRIINSRDSPLVAKWGSIELTQTMHFLLYTACSVSKSKASHFVFLSESCVPIVSPAMLRMRIEELGPRSQFRIERMHECTDKKYSVPRQFMAIAREIPEECVLKSDQWAMLSQDHAKAILQFCTEISKVAPLWYLIASISKASDELFIPTTLCLALNAFSVGNIDAEIDTRRITYTEHPAGAPHPRLFANLSYDLVHNARASGACFLRKISAPSNADAAEKVLRGWYDAVMAN